MPNIRINYDGLEQQASNIKGISDSYEGLNKRLEELKVKTTSGWEGEASNAYSEMMQNYILKAAKMKGLLDKFAGIAKEVNINFQTVDQECAKLIRDSF